MKINTRTVRRAMLPALAVGVAALAAGCGSSSSSSTSSAAANATDRAFVQQMIPHHDMAVQMAQSAQKQGQHAQLKTLAASIITAQDREIAQMKPLATQISVTPDQMPTGGSTMGGHMMGDAQALGLSMGPNGNVDEHELARHRQAV